ncbi:MAG: chemotaxis protein CheX [Chloroflexota bacterium]|nr:MAG: chemotaxis protein CheX [Chloroflexota bacterium]
MDAKEQGTIGQTLPFASEAHLQAAVANLVHVATERVFTTMITEEFEFVNLEDLTDPGGEILAMVGIAGRLSGVLSVHCTRGAGVTVAAGMLGMEPEEVDEDSDVLDAMGELANIIAGNVKTELGAEGEPLSLSVPTVVTGRDFQVETLSSGVRVDLAVTASGHPLRIGLVIEQSGE